MAGTLSDFKIYEDQFFGGAFEVLEDNVNAFNAASMGCITLRTEFMKGQFSQRSFFQKPANLVTDRDPTSVSSASDTKLTMSEFKSPKVNKKIGPVQNTIDSFKKAGVPLDRMAFMLGQQAAPDIMGAYLTSAVAGLIGAYGVSAVSTALKYDASGHATLKHTDLVQGLAQFGDAAQNISLWVMHSKVFFDLLGNAISDKLLEVTAGAIYKGVPGTLGRPVLVTDNASLVTVGSSTASSADDRYATFGLTANGVNVAESEERSMLIEVVGGLNNLVLRYQGEFAYNVEVKGMAWKTQVSPTTAQLASASNWSMAAASKKSLPGVMILSK